MKQLNNIQHLESIQANPMMPPWISEHIHALSDLSDIAQTSNQTFEKRDDGTIYGLRYIISPEPSTLRPVKSWSILIEEWTCDNDGTITATDILSLRILNGRNVGEYQYDELIKDINVNHERVRTTQNIGFNALMAATLFISKIDAQRMPNITKTLGTYNLL